MAKKENSANETPSTSAATRTANVLGLEYTLTGVPQTVEEYDTAAGRNGACLDRALQHDVAHRFNAQARGAVVESVIEALVAQNGEGYTAPEQADKESEDAFIKRLKDEGIIDDAFLKALPALTVEFSLTSTRSRGPSKQFKDAAKEAINTHGSAEKVAEALSNAGYPCQPNEESIASAFKRRFEDLQRQATSI